MEKVCGLDNQTLGLALCFAMHGIPLIYNGQEIADSRRHSIFGHSPEVTIDWTLADTDVGRRRRDMVRSFAALRRDNAATINVSQGKSDATVKFSVDGGEPVTFDGKIVLPDGSRRSTLRFSPSTAGCARKGRVRSEEVLRRMRHRAQRR